MSAVGGSSSGGSAPQRSEASSGRSSRSASTAPLPEFRTGEAIARGQTAPALAPLMTSSASRTSFGLVDGRPVFVDLVDDSYFTLEPAEEDAFLALVDRSRASEPT